MQQSLAADINKNIVIYVNDFYPEFATAFTKLSERLGRPLRGLMLIDEERKRSGKYLPGRDGFFEEIIVDFSDDATLRQTLKSFEGELLLVSCDSERSQLYFKKVIPHVPYINTPTESSLDYCTDKGKMRELLLSYDPAISPRAITVHDASQENISMIGTTLDFPLIVKPTNLAASQLVNKASDVSELQSVLNRSFTFLNEIYSQYRGLGNKTMLVEEYVEGDLYSTDAYVDATGNVHVLPFIHFQNGSMAGFGGYQEYKRSTYLTLSKDEQLHGVEVAKKAVHAVGLRSSVAHIELFHHADGWKVVELGARPGGWRQQMYMLSYDVDHAFNELLVKIGLDPVMPAGLKTHSAMFCISAPKSGVVVSITGVEEASSHERMSELQVNIKPGDKVLPSALGGKLIIEGLMHNTDIEQLDQDIATVRSNIVVTINQGEGDE